MFHGADLSLEDLCLLESFQIEYLQGWVPERAVERRGRNRMDDR